MNDWTCALLNRSSVAVAYIDFQKAFDSVCHTKLFCKLESMGFIGNLLQWLVSFLLTDGSVHVSAIVCQSPPELLRMRRHIIKSFVIMVSYGKCRFI